MFRFLTGGPTDTGPTFPSVEDEIDTLKHALAAGPHILSDQYDKAEEHLSARESPFHKLGHSVVVFLRGVLGNEEEVLKKALARLSDLDTSATDYKARAATSEPFESNIYPKGSQYALCQAHCFIMTLVINFLRGNMVEAAKGLLKARRAYLILQELAACENTCLETYRAEHGLKALHLSEDKDVNDTSKLEQEQAEKALFDHPIDSFTQSGVNLCYGALQILFSMIPPTMAKMIAVVGFKGDRIYGLDMLWRASPTEDVHGALSSFFLLDYHVNMASICDMYAPNDFPKHRLQDLLANMKRLYPRMRLMYLEAGRMLIVQSRIAEAIDLMTSTPASPIRQIESQVMFQSSLQCISLHRYEQCAEGFLKCTSLNNWSHSMYYYCAGCSYAEMYRTAIRAARGDEAKIAEAQKIADKAVDCLRQAPPKAGKRRMMTRKIPLDVFVTRKVHKWQARATARNIPLIEAMGTVPIEEMNFLWLHAFKFMSPQDLEVSLARLEEEEVSDIWNAKEDDEKCIHHILKAKVLIQTDRTAEAREIITSKLLTKPAHEFSGPEGERWILPNANYEMAVIAWKEAGGYAGHESSTAAGSSKESTNGGSRAAVEAAPASTSSAPAEASTMDVSEDTRKAKLVECSSYINKVSRWKEDWDFAGGIHMACRIARRTLDQMGVH